MTEQPRLDAAYEGSVSEGTMNPRHLVPRFVAILETIDPRHQRVEEFRVLWAATEMIGQFTRDAATDVADLLGLWECESMGYLLEGLFDALNEIAPKGTSFGASEGDGASYGFWRDDQCDCGHAFASHDEDVPGCYDLGLCAECGVIA